MKRLATLFALGLAAAPAFSATGIFQTYIILNRGSGNEYYAGGINSDPGTSYTTLNLGTQTSSSTLTLNGGEVKTFKNGGGDVTGAEICYRVFRQGDTPGSFSCVNLAFGQNYPTPGDQQWTTTNANVNLLSGVNQTGNWTLEFYWRALTNEGDRFDNNGGSNYTRDFVADSSLPVELSSLTATASGNAAVVRWTTESETNNAGFDLQTLRSGAWATVATRTGRGTTAERTRYEERIDGLAAGRHTFRLVQRDLDGTATVAGTVELVIGGASALVAETRGTSVRFGAAAAQAVTVEAYDVTGRRVATLFAGSVAAGEMQSAELTGVAPGVYLVRVTGRSGSATTPVVVR